MSEERRIVEINGVKMEIDTRTASRIDTFKVGDAVKVLKKKYSDDWRVYHGVIVGFEPFEKQPTIVIAYIEDSYNDLDMQMLYFNSTSKEVEVVRAAETDRMALDKGQVLEHFERKLTVKRREFQDIESQRDYFLSKFGTYFQDTEQQETA